MCMENNNFCNNCINKEMCCQCGKHKDKFIPNEDVRPYFQRVYIGTKGINGYIWRFNTTNEHLLETQGVSIYGELYCPYCGEKMHCIQERETLFVIGYCCFCEGARKELEYKKERKALEEKHKLEFWELEKEYEGMLDYDIPKLLETKISREKSKLHNSNYSYFSTINGKRISNISQLV